MKLCNRYRNNILRYLDGEVTETERLRFDSHLEECNSCTQLLERTRHLNNSRFVFPGEADPTFIDKVQERIASLRTERELPLFTLRPAMLAAAVVVPLILGIWLGYTTHKHQNLQQVSGELASEIHQMLTTPGYATLDAYPYGYAED